MAVTDTQPAMEDLAAIAHEVESFIRGALPAPWIAAVDQDDLEALAPVRQQVDPDALWARIGAEGYISPTWARRYGGRGVSRAAAKEISKTLARYRMPRFNNPVGSDLAGPAILQWGTDEQKDQFLAPIARYEHIWCQLFSEPGAGSDLAALSTRAIRDGEMWRVTGQKVWTSLADISRYGIMLCRTNPEVPKHKGITAFVLPMDLQGVTIRPLRQLTGDAEFSEVFLDDVQLDDTCRLGPVDQGWRVAISVLMNERSSTAGGGSLPGVASGRSVGSLIARHAPVGDPVLRQRLVQLYIEDRLITLTNQRAAARRRAGQPSGPEGSVSKLFFSEHTQRLQNMLLDLDGPSSQAWVQGDRWSKNSAWSFLRSRSKTIAGGTSEVQRNILGERVLGLPREPEVDRDLAWSQVKRS